MGSDKSWHIINAVFFFFFSSLMFSSIMARGSSTGSYDSDSLDNLIRGYADRIISSQNRTGLQYQIVLPSNFTDMHVSVIRLRTGSLFERGANISSIHIPPKVIPKPYVKRIAVVYQNIGNLSSLYYKLPNYTLVSPVIGLNAYDASNWSALSDKKLEFKIVGEPILINFPRIELDGKKVTPKCAEFGPNKLAVISDMVGGNACVARGGGHFSVVVPSQRGRKKGRRRKKMMWVTGTAGVFVGLLFLSFVVVAIVKCWGRREIRKMEKEAEKQIALETTWIADTSRMPTASAMRTQPVLEHHYVP